MGRKSRSKHDDKDAILNAIYGLIPKVECKGLCIDTCNVIPTNPFEKARIEAKLGKPFEPIGQLPAKINCSALTNDGKCSVYSVRPTVCRLYGAVDWPAMKCPHGCTVKNPLSFVGAMEIMATVQSYFGRSVTPVVKNWPFGPEGWYEKLKGWRR